MNNEDFYKALKKLEINLSEQMKEQLDEYYNLLIEYNEHTNITAITKKEDVYLKHFYDSALLSQSININEIETMLDIGCGAGFPGLVIKILYPHIKLTLLDSNNKKTRFCEYVVNKLNLKDVDIVTARAEEYIVNRREHYNLVTARAVKNLPVLSELAIPYVKIDGKFIAMKASYEEELNNSLKGIELLGGKYLATQNIDLPNELGKRNFIIIKKTSKTDMKYPRQYNKILKHPL